MRRVSRSLEDLSNVSLVPGLAIAMAGGAAGALAAMGIWKIVRSWRRPDPAEVERLRRLGVNACGRITTGKIVELLEPTPDTHPGTVLLYEYEVAGVTYQAAQDVSALPEVASAAPFLPGQIASVKYDPRHPTNSIFACEAWSGVADLTRSGTSPESPVESSHDSPLNES